MNTNNFSVLNANERLMITYPGYSSPFHTHIDLLPFEVLVKILTILHEQEPLDPTMLVSRRFRSASLEVQRVKFQQSFDKSIREHISRPLKHAEELPRMVKIYKTVLANFGVDVKDHPEFKRIKCKVEERLSRCLSAKDSCNASLEMLGGRCFKLWNVSSNDQLKDLMLNKLISHLSAMPRRNNPLLIQQPDGQENRPPLIRQNKFSYSFSPFLETLTEVIGQGNQARSRQLVDLIVALVQKEEPIAIESFFKRMKDVCEAYPELLERIPDSD